MENSLKYHDVLLELLKLREQFNMDSFMENLYETMLDPDSPFRNGSKITQEQQAAISIMIEHFQKKEEYEKCMVLKRMAEGVKK